MNAVVAGLPTAPRPGPKVSFSPTRDRRNAIAAALNYTRPQSKDSVGTSAMKHLSPMQIFLVFFAALVVGFCVALLSTNFLNNSEYLQGISASANAAAHPSGSNPDVSRQVDLDNAFRFGDAHKEHSAQFRSYVPLRSPYWNQLLNSFELQIVE